MRCRILLALCLTPLLPAATVPLALVAPIISDTDGGAALPSGTTHVPGDTLFFSAQVEGFKATSADKVHLTYKVEAFDPNGVPIIQPADGEIEETLAPQDRNWKPVVRQDVIIPPLAASGTYKIAVSIKDLVADATATLDVPFVVHGHTVEPSDTLAIRNFRFYHSEQDPHPAERAVFRPGGELWGRFDIIGYKFGKGNAVDVSYDVAVVSSAGKVLWSQADAAVEQGDSFYPKRYVPGSMSINLQKNTHPGEYAIQITAHDRIGNQIVETRQPFTIEE